MRRSCLVIVFLLMHVPAWGTTYYVDATGGNDSNAGTATNNAWKTIHKVNTSTFSGGDSILFKRGETWREQLTVPSSGSAGSVITFEAYGTGAAPIIDASDIITPGTSWTKDVVGGNIWTATATNEPKIVFFDNVKGTKVVSQAACNGTGKWFWANNVLSVYSASNPDTAYTAPGIQVGKRTYAVYSDKNYVTLAGLHFTKGNNYNLLSTGNHVTIQNCEVSYAGNHGIAYAGSTGNNLLTLCNIHHNGSEQVSSGVFGYHDAGTLGNENYISYNNIYNNYSFGIQLWSNYYIIENNHVYNNGNTTEMTVGIEIIDPDNAGYGRYNVIRYNKVHGQKSGLNNGEGIDLDDYSAYNIVYYNLSYRNDGPGITLWRSNNNTVYNNVAYGNCLNSGGALTTKAEIDISSDGPGLTYNNIIKNNVGFATQANTYAVWIGPSSYNSEGLNITNNIWYSAATNWYFWNATGGSNLATWNALTSIGMDINSNPSIADPENGDFTLQASSPAINTGVDVGLTRDYVGNAVPLGAFPDIGAYERQFAPTGGGTRIPVPPAILFIN